MEVILIAMMNAEPPRFRPGWPVSFIEMKSYSMATPFLGGYFYHKDYGKDTSGVVYPPRCYVWDPNGQDIPPWPSGIFQSENRVLISEPYPVGDLNGDGGLDFVIGRLDYIEAYDFTTGNMLWHYLLQHKERSGLIGLYDMDGDSNPEAVFWETDWGGNTYIVHAIKGDGSELPGWPLVLPGRFTIMSMPVPSTHFILGDPDVDGEAEIVLWIGREDMSWREKIYMINARGEVEPGWPVKLGEGLPDTMIAEHVEAGFAGDLNGDGYQEIVLLIYRFRVPDSLGSKGFMIRDLSENPTAQDEYGDTCFLWVLDHRGNMLPGWPKQGLFYSPRLGDFTGDGLPEILVVSVSYTQIGESLEVYDYLGNLVFSSDVRDIPVRWIVLWGPAVADLDGDDVGDLVIPLGANSKPRADGVEIMETSHILSGGLVAWSPLNGFLWGVNLRYVAEDPEPFPIHMCMGTLAFPILFDIDGNGLAEIFTHVGEYIAKTGGCPAIAYTLQSFYVLELSEPAKMMWPMPFHDNWNTNNYDFWPQNPAFTPAHETTPKPGASVSLAQNPTRGKVAVLMKLSGEQSVIIKAYDPTGRLVKSADFGKLGFGEHRLEMPIEPGVYFISVETGPERKTLKAIVK